MSSTGNEMDLSDSRKRPLDGDIESGVTKRSNQGSVGTDVDEDYMRHFEQYEGAEGEEIHHIGDQFPADENNVQVKVLVPSVAAGAIIGKGGETITHIQKDTGATIKMSKANDYYPGTTERVCLINGHMDGVKNVLYFIVEKIRERPDPNPKPLEGELKVNFERHKQVKVLIPNSTAGMIIGKGGNYIRQIKEESGAYVQISQKSKDMNLPERCVTIAVDNAGDPEKNKLALDMIVQKIAEDPHSNSCPNISYADYHGPVASTNPTGSPFAAGSGGPVPVGPGRPGQSGGLMGGILSNSLGTSMNNLNISSTAANNTGGGGGGTANNPALENLKATLRGSGYSEQAIEEISAAMYTLANYGFLGLGLGLNQGSGGLNLGGTTGLGGLSMGGNSGGAGAGLNLGNLGSLLTGGAGSNNSGGSLLGNGNNGNGGGSVFGPVGSGSSMNMVGGGDTGQDAGSSFFGAGGGDSSMFNDSYNSGGGSGFASGSFSGTNQNSFGLGTGMGSFGASGDDKGSSPTKKELEVGEHIVGAILGPGGRGIVELQQFTGANIQISKKGVYAPGTRNRIVSITGSPNSVNRAQFLIQQRITQEETKRARQGPKTSR